MPARKVRQAIDTWGLKVKGGRSCIPPHLSPGPSLHPSTSSHPPTMADYAAAWEAVAKDIIYVPSQQRYTRAASATNTDRVASMQVARVWGRDGAGLVEGMAVGARVAVQGGQDGRWRW